MLIVVNFRSLKGNGFDHRGNPLPTNPLPRRNACGTAV
jgi:hypothetical protein